jgi:HlyD family secretion protein
MITARAIRPGRGPLPRGAAVAFAALLLLGGCGKGPPQFQGFVEGEFLRIGPDEPGRLAVLSVRRGDIVEAGAPLFRLEAETFEADRAAAESRLREAEAALADLMAEQQRPEEIEVLMAGRARAAADVRLTRAEEERQRRLHAEGFAATARLQQAQADAQRAEASLAEVERQIGAAQLTARIQRIEQARGAVEAARGALEAAAERLARRTVSAPEGGLIQDVLFYPGELVPAAQPVVSLLPPERRKIVFYVSEPWRVRFRPGTVVRVTCDSCPDDLTATVDFVSAEEEFTPPVIFSPEERAKLVYRVEARPARPLALSPGQPVSVILTAQQPMTENGG